MRAAANPRSFEAWTRPNARASWRREDDDMNTANDQNKSSRYSRRGFLKRAGAGAGAVAVSGGVGAAIAPRAVAARSATVSTSPTTFGRIFPNMPPFAAASYAVPTVLADLATLRGILAVTD